MKLLHVTATHLKPDGGVPVVLKNLVSEQNRIENFRVKVISLVAPVDEMDSPYFEYVGISNFEKKIDEFCPDLVILHSFYYIVYNHVVHILNKKNIRYYIEPHGSFGKAALNKSKIKKIIANNTVFKSQLSNAYGFILCSIFFFGITLFMEAKQKGNYGDFAKKGLLVCVIVMILAAWWFVRNAILYDGDFLGMNASSICAEKYAKPAYKPSEKQTPQMAGYTLWDMLNQGFPKSEGFSWVELVSESFVGRFGNMNVFMPKWLINNYMDFIKAGFLLIFLHPVKTFALRVKKQWSVKGMFNWFMLIAMIIPNILNAYYSYASDYQPQGRYSLPMLIPMTYFMVMGYGNLFDVTVKNEKVRKGVYAAICVALMVLALFVFFAVIWPEYRDVPFSIRAFIAGM